MSELDGTYDVVVKSPLGDQKSVLTIKIDGSSFSGTNTDANGATNVSGDVDGASISWKQAITVPMPITLQMKATVDGDSLKGTATAGGFGSFPMTGVRQA